MKLDKELKERIDRYFNNISAEELYEISVTKYGFKEDTSFELVDEPFEIIEADKYSSNIDNSYSSDVVDNSLNSAA